MKCIDCDYFMSCEINDEVCNKYKHTPKVITRLKRKDGEIFEFEKMEVKGNERI